MTIRLTHESRTAVSRARFFLEKAKACPIDSRIDFEAFLEATIVFARAAVHRLKTQFERHAQWKACWDGLRSDPAVEFFRTERDWILKEAPPKLGQKIFVASVGSMEPTYVPPSASEMYYFTDPNLPATTTVEQFLTALERRLAEAEHRFRNAPA